MKYFIDCEFIENGSMAPIELLSIGIVAEDGRWFYGENGDADFLAANDWVKANVLPTLSGVQDQFTEKVIAANILDLVHDDPSPEFWGWCCGYDYVLVSQLIGFNRWPDGWPYYFRDIQQTADELGSSLDDVAGPSNHNALDDAKQIRKLWHYLAEIAP
jgi:hypothetical protein